MVAVKTKCYKHEVIAMWFYLLECASRKNNNGYLGNIDFEEIDFALDFTPNKSEKIYLAFVERGKIKDGSIVNWQEYQADTSKERTKKWREKQRDVTSQNVTERHGDDVTVEEKRREEIRIEEKRRNIPPEISPDWQMIAMNKNLSLQEAKSEFESFANHYLAKKEIFDDYFPLWKNWIARYQPKKPTAFDKQKNNRPDVTELMKNGTI
jgi:hypothetical protein